MGQQDPPGETETAQTATGAVDLQWHGRRSIGLSYLHLRRHHGWQIETSYRQKNQARAWTTSRSLEYRLLLEGVAHVLRQVWVCRSAAAARAKKWRPTEWVGDLAFVDLLEGIADQLRQQYPLAWPSVADLQKHLENKG